MVMFCAFLVYVPTLINLEWERRAVSELSLSNMDYYHFYVFMFLEGNSKEIRLGYFGCLPYRTIYVKSRKTPWTSICSVQQLLFISFHLLQISHYSQSFVPKVTSLRLCLHPTCCKSSSNFLSHVEILILSCMLHYTTRTFSFKSIFELL